MGFLRVSQGLLQESFPGRGLGFRVERTELYYFLHSVTYDIMPLFEELLLREILPVPGGQCLLHILWRH